MKKELSMLALMVTPFFMYSQITDPAPYCTGAFDNENGPSTNYISAVSIGDWQNLTGTTPSSGGHYRYYNNLDAIDLIKGDDYVFTVTGDNANGIVGHFMAVYIDFNQDDDFEDAGERIMHYDFMALSDVNEETITIPNTALTGITRMRVILFEDDDYTWIEAYEEAMPCTVYENGLLDWGESEDYDVNIQVAAGVEEVSTLQPLCYPNPAAGFLHFNTDPGINPTCKIYNSAGSLVCSSIVENGSINIEFLPEGIYVIEIATADHITKQRFTKSR